jgi:hypothetical protein
MLTAAFDASGSDHDQELLVVAGYLSGAVSWDRFTEDWLDAIKPGTEFHATEWHHRLRDGFDDDPTVKRLVGIVQALRYKCVCGVRIDNFSVLSASARQSFYRNAYVLAASTCVTNLSTFLFYRGIGASDVEWVFERGDVGANEFHALMQREEKKLPIFKPKRDRYDQRGILTEHAFVPLQAADFLAHETFRASRDQKNSPTNTELHRVPGPMSEWTPSDLAALQTLMDDVAQNHGGEYYTGF